jgi:hypothetical protein
MFNVLFFQMCELSSCYKVCNTNDFISYNYDTEKKKINKSGLNKSSLYGCRDRINSNRFGGSAAIRGLYDNNNTKDLKIVDRSPAALKGLYSRDNNLDKKLITSKNKDVTIIDRPSAAFSDYNKNNKVDSKLLDTYYSGRSGSIRIGYMDSISDNMSDNFLKPKPLKINKVSTRTIPNTPKLSNLSTPETMSPLLSNNLSYENNFLYSDSLNDKNSNKNIKINSKDINNKDGGGGSNSKIGYKSGVTYTSSDMSFNRKVLIAKSQVEENLKSKKNGNKWWKRY